MTSWSDYNAHRLREDERRGVFALDQLTRSFETACRRLDGRLKGYRYYRRDIGMVQAACKRLYIAAVKDVDPALLMQIERQSRDYVLDSVRKTIVPPDEVVVTTADIETLLNLVLDSHCAMCMTEGSAARGCKVRRLLRKFTDEPDPGFMPCGFVARKMNDNKKG